MIMTENLKNCKGLETPRKEKNDQKNNKFANTEKEELITVNGIQVEEEFI